MKEKKKKSVMKINGLMKDEDILWKKLKCVCAQDPNDIEHRFPLTPCNHCNCMRKEESLPRVPFEIIEDDIDSKGKPKGTKHTRLVTEITIDRGSLDEIRGWIF